MIRFYKQVQTCCNWCDLIRFQTCLNLSKLVKTCSNLSKTTIWQNSIKFDAIRHNWHVQTCHNAMIWFDTILQTCPDLFKYYDTIWYDSTTLLTAECIWFKCSLYLRFIPPINLWKICIDLRPFSKCFRVPFSRTLRSPRSNNLVIQNDKNSKRKTY